MNFALEALRPPPSASAGISSERTEPAQAMVGRTRLNSIDLLRGLVMVVMALDHTRDFFAAGSFNPRDVTEPALFLTRWVTHFCAPTFILLAGISAFLYGARRQTGEVGRYLFTRGCWLVLVEFTVVRLGWSFNFHFDHLVLQVIFAIGVSMIVLAALVHLPRWTIATVGIVMIAGHNMFDAIKAAPDNTFKMGGTGSKQEDQIITVALQKVTGKKMIYIPQSGGGAVAVQLVGNHVDSSVNNPIEAVAHWRAGKLSPLCVFDGKKLDYKKRSQAICSGTTFRPASRRASTSNM